MEVFFHGLAPNTSEKRVEKYLGEKLRLFSIQHFLFEKKRRSNCAVLTLLDVVNGERFLQAYSQSRTGLFLDKQFRCAPSRNKPDQFKLRSIEKRLIDQAKKARKTTHGPPTLKQFDGYALSCGVWDYPDDVLTYVPSFMHIRPLRIYFGKKELVVLVDPSDKSSGETELRIGIDYSSIHGLTSANTQDPSILLTLYHPPRFYKVPSLEDLEPSRANQSDMDRLTNDLRRALHLGKPPRPPKRVRIPALNNRHAAVASQCYVYALTMSPEHVEMIRNLIHRKRFLPDLVVWPFRNASSSSLQNISFRDLVNQLQTKFQNIDFGIRFQLQRLAQNLYLPPHVVHRLIPKVQEFESKLGTESTVSALQQFSKRIEYAGPASDATLFTISNLEALLNAQDDSYDSLSAFALARRYSHLVLIHRASRTYLF